MKNQNHKKKLSVALLFTCLFSYSFNLMAWNFQGHQLISEIAYTELSISEQNKLDKVLDALIIQLPPKYKKIFKKQPYGLSKLAKLSIMPDLWKNYNLNELYNILNITDKSISNNIPNQRTNDWHYKSIFIKNNKKNNSKQSDDKLSDGKLDDILSIFISNVNNTSNKTSQAFAIIFITHLLEDAHQPLHAMSKELTNSKNNYDKGGNLHCLRTKNNSCTFNLHQYWDNAAGLLNSKDVKSLANSIHLHHPKSSFDTKHMDSNPKNWLQESFEYKSIVYRTAHNSMPNKLYQANARIIASERMALAAYRLSDLIKTVLN